MSPEEKLHELATRIADRHLDRMGALEREKREVEAQLAQIQSYLDAAKLANDHLADYKARVGEKYRCPRCAIDRGNKVALNPILSGDKIGNRFRCKECQLEIE